MTGTAHPSGESHDEHHGSLAIYGYVFASLCVLTGASFFTYSDAWPFKGEDLKWIKWVFMMAVSCTKAFLVIMFFMHLKYEKSWKYVLTVPTIMMATFLMLMLIPDVGRRTHHYTPERNFFADPEPLEAPSADRANDRTHP